MKTTATDAQVEKEPPCGVYKGMWNGYYISFDIHGETWTAKTEDGLRGINVPCTVIVLEDGSIEVEDA